MKRNSTFFCIFISAILLIYLFVRYYSTGRSSTSSAVDYVYPTSPPERPTGQDKVTSGASGVHLREDLNVHLYPAVYSDDIPIMRAKSPQKFDIPRILHVQWKTDVIPDFATPFLKLWKRYLPDWKLMFWSDKSMDDFVNHVYGQSEFQVYYKKFPSQIFRVDFMRYVILYYFGGIYADLDVEPLRSLDPLLGYHSCVIAREPEPYSIASRVDSSLLASNVLMIARKHHPFWISLINDIRARKGHAHPVVHVGPFAVTSSLRNYFSQNQWRPLESSVFLSPSLYFYPPTKAEEDKDHIQGLQNACGKFLMSGSSFAKRICRFYHQEKRIDWSDMYSQKRFFNESFTRHHMLSSWFKSSKPQAGTTRFQDIFKSQFLTFHFLQDRVNTIQAEDPFRKNEILLKG